MQLLIDRSGSPAPEEAELTTRLLSLPPHRQHHKRAEPSGSTGGCSSAARDDPPAWGHGQGCASVTCP